MIVPAAGAGTSASTLSVETSTIVSPSATVSPTATWYSSTVPSVTDSPISGISTSPRTFGVAIRLAARGRGRVGPAAEVASPSPVSATIVRCRCPRATVLGGRAAGALEAAPPLPSPGVDLGQRLADLDVLVLADLRILVIVPLCGAGTSASTLSVETSTIVSPSETVSPSATCHSSTVPSVTDSPIAGISIETLPLLLIGCLWAPQGHSWRTH